MITRVANDSLGIYIHIPFCVSKCYYCDFLSFQTNPSDELVINYIEALKREIKAYGELYKDYTVDTIFIGGGTPSMISESHIISILEEIYGSYSINRDRCEITIEVNPGTVNREKLSAYYNIGVNRLSIGVQSCDDDILNMLGRIHTYSDFINTYNMAIEVGFNNISVDMMVALPNQDIERAIMGIKKIIAIKPKIKHMSVYSLILEEGTIAYREWVEIDEELERDIYKLVGEELEVAGLCRYEISNYAMQGYESKHNIRYWDGSDYVGMGLGASSYMRGIRWKNIDDIYEYIDEDENYQKLRREEEIVSKKASMEEFFFLGLRMMRGVSENEFRNRYGIDIDDVYSEVTNELIRDQLLERISIKEDIIEDVAGNKGSKEDMRLRLTKRGIDVSNYCFTKFLL